VRTKRLLAGFAAIAATFALIACSTGYSSLDGADASSAGGDATVAIEAGAADGTANPIVDAGSPVDGAVKGPSHFCDTQDASFCWSFDNQPYLTGPKLTAIVNTDGGLAALTDASVSAPYALHTEMNANAQALAGVQWNTSVAAIHCEGDVRIGTSTSAFVYLQINDTGGATYLRINGNGLGMEVASTNGMGTSSNGLPTAIAGQWAHFALTVDTVLDAVTTSFNGVSQKAIQFKGKAPLVSVFWGIINPGPVVTSADFDNLYCY
jgi:hypothetical protein